MVCGSRCAKPQRALITMLKLNQIQSNDFLYVGARKNPELLLKLAKKLDPKPFAITRAESRSILLTARDAESAGLIKPILIGEQAIIEREANKVNWSLEKAKIINSVGEAEAIDKSIELVRNGQALGLMKGQIHTDVFMSGIVRRNAGIRTDKRLIHVFVMFPPNQGKPLLISDAAININPDIETRVNSALLMADMLRKLGVARPKIAMLSATESILPNMQSSIEASEIASRAAETDGQADFAGPLSFDLAISPQAVAEKNIENTVAGKADALVVPDIVSGNILFKSLVWCAGGLAAGMVLGGRVPIILTSRSDPPEARLAATAIASSI